MPHYHLRQCTVVPLLDVARNQLGNTVMSLAWFSLGIFGISDEVISMARTKQAPRKVSRSTIPRKKGKGVTEPAHESASSLPDETLRILFSVLGDIDSSFINALRNEWDPDLTGSSRLNDIRSASQVCKRWRTLILRSPSIWASAIELGCLNQVGDKWRNEVLKRTGREPLTVVGIQKKSDPSTQFLALLLDYHWPRMHSLCVYGEDCGIENIIWRALESPAPKLECCILRFSTNMTTKTFPFSGIAPRLQYFSVPGIRMKFQSSWVSRINHLWLVNTPLVPVSQVLRAIGEMPYLQSLMIKNSLDSDEIRQSWVLVRIPSLTTIRFYDGLDSLGMLSRIYPSNHCSLDIESTGNRMWSLTRADISDVVRAFAVMFTTSAFASIEDLIIDIDSLSFHIGDMDNSSDKLHTFDLRISLDTLGFDHHASSEWDRMIHLALEAASKSNLSHITSLCIDGASDYLSESQLPVHGFLRSLRSVRTLHANSDTLEFLTKIYVSPGRKGFDILRGLDEIVLDDERVKPELVLQFLLLRRDAGLPIKTFDLSSKDPELFEKLRFMMGFPGLNVVR